jgi:hypothetical protein
MTNQKIENIVLFKIVSQRVKYFWTKTGKRSTRLYTGNYKILLIAVKEELHKWRYICACGFKDSILLRWKLSTN